MIKNTLIIFSTFISFICSYTISNDEVSEERRNLSHITYDYGKASDCARAARTTVLVFAEQNGHNPNGEHFDAYIATYHRLYEACFFN
jgi:hypothetical protein